MCYIFLTCLGIFEYSIAQNILLLPIHESIPRIISLMINPYYTGIRKHPI